MRAKQKLILALLIFINHLSQNSGQENTLSENDVSSVYKESLCAECEIYYEGNCYPDYSLYKTDDFGAYCCSLLMEPVAILVIPTRNDDWGHAAIKTPNQTKGLYPKVGASFWDPADYGKIKDDSETPFSDSFHYCACPETVIKLDAWIKEQENKINSDQNPWGGPNDQTYHAANLGSSKNCIGWAALAIKSVGGKPPVDPDESFLTVPAVPEGTPSGGPDGSTRDCP